MSTRPQSDSGLLIVAHWTHNFQFLDALYCSLRNQQYIYARWIFFQILKHHTKLEHDYANQCLWKARERLRCLAKWYILSVYCAIKCTSYLALETLLCSLSTLVTQYGMPTWLKLDIHWSITQEALLTSTGSSGP